MIRGLALSVAVLALAAGGASAWSPTAHGESTVEVVVRLQPPSLAAGGTTAAVASAQRAFETALASEMPAARVRWRYRVVLDGLAVAVPHGDAARLRRLPGVAEVFQPARYPMAAGPAGDQIGAPQLWGPDLSSAGDGVKIGIIDVGVDQSNPFFDPTGFVMPPGFPKGQVAYTTAKVIVARSFPAPGQTSAADLRPVDPEEGHGTHVAGIAAGDAGTRALGAVISGVAPRAYLGNYRALTVPTDGGVGKDGNAAELVAAIEAAVQDGMDVINLSVGEAEIEPSRDVVALALDGAAAAGVVPVVSAGNDFAEYGEGSISSPGNATGAITVAAVSTARSESPNVVADFSSSGPTPISLRLKPDVAAPGTSVLSSIPGGWGTLSGTSMAAPHVAGGVALLRQRHPDWTVGQIKAALVETGDDTWLDNEHTKLATPARSGGGLIDLPRADSPLVFTSPSSVSLGLLPAGARAQAEVRVSDAGGGAGTWTVSLHASAPSGTSLTTQPVLEVPGALTLTATAAATATEGNVTGYVVLARSGESRRIPFWLRVTRPRLKREPATRLIAPGVYEGNTRGRAGRVSRYRYPQLPGNGAVHALNGPEQVFKVVLKHPVENFGVAVIARAAGVRVEPRVVAAVDENRLTGYPALPLVINPYLAGFGSSVLAAAAVRPRPGTYAIVFDSRTATGAGKFSFRFWVNDVTPPSVRLLARRVVRGNPVTVRVSDGGSGIDAGTATAKIDGKARNTSISGTDLKIDTGGLQPGTHRLQFQISDYQETRNMENVSAVLPNTGRINVLFTVTR